MLQSGGKCLDRGCSRVETLPLLRGGANVWHSLELLRSNEPGYHIHRISPTPLLMSVAEGDVLTPTDLALEAYSRAKEPKQLQLIPGGHFDAYSGPNFEANAGTQTEFLKKWLLR